MIRPSKALGLAVAALLILSACSSSKDSGGSPADTPLPQNVAWLPCGEIECGQVSLEVDSEAPELGSVKIALYRRASQRSSKAPTLILVSDRRYGYSPRTLAEEAALHFGSTIDGYNVVSVASRGMVDSPMPVGAETRIATLDVVEDLEAIREALSIDSVFAIGWGTGATAVTTWKMQYPESIKATVVDSPQNPSMSMGQQIVAQLESSRAAALTAVKWCASHLSCQLNAEVADEIQRFKLKMLTGTVPASVTKQVVARAAANALAVNRPNDIFTAMAEAIDGNGEPFVALAGPEPVVSDAYAVCADVSQATAARMALRAAEMHAEKTRQFPIGSEPTMYAMCAQLPPSSRPLGEVQSFKDAKEDKVLVTIARGDPIVPPAPARKMAASMEWTYKSVFANRHLVVGFDQAITAAAMEFLAS